MNKIDLQNPFHEGERAAQARAGVGDVAQWAGGFIRDYLPEQHRDFHTGLPFLVASGADASGQTWVTMIDGPEGFARAPNPRLIELNTRIDPTDPLANTFQEGTDIGVLGIELASRRRNRFSGAIRGTASGYAIDIRQTFGNCPQYIHERALTRVPKEDVVNAQTTNALSAEQIALIGAADTMFIGSGHQGRAGAASNGYDASHRAGAPGFVYVVDDTHLQIPDYAGNNFFNTIGNLVSDPRVGLLFVDFATGGLLHLTGRAKVDWAPQNAHDPDAWRMINVEIDAVVERPGAVSLRWEKVVSQTRTLRLVRRVEETDSITSFCLAPVDDHPLATFQPGQHLPVSIQIPGQAGRTARSYSLSGAASDQGQYRLSIKRESHGLMSRFLHDTFDPGAVIQAQPPAGAFVLPKGEGPVVLVSAGVGLTPMVSMLHAAAQTGRQTWYVHGARNGAAHAHHAEVAELIAQHQNLHQRIYYSQPGAEDGMGRDYDVQGRISANDLAGLKLGKDTDYMLCGPASFIAKLTTGLEEQGIMPDRIHSEAFGPSVVKA